MNIIIIEPFSSGHHMSLYLKNILKFLIKKNWSITLITSDKAINSEAFKSIKKEYGKNFSYHTINSIDPPSMFIHPATILIYQFRWWLKIKSVYKKLHNKNKFDLAYFPSIDFIIHPLTIIKSPFQDTPFFTTYISSKKHLYHIEKHSDFKQKIKKLIYNYLICRLLSLKSLIKLFIIESDVFSYLKKKNFEYINKIKYLPDFADTECNISKSEARKYLGIEKSEFVILGYGALSKRKGILNLLECVEQANSSLSNIKIIVAGIPERLFLDEFNKLIKKSNLLQSVVIKQLYFHNDELENIVFAASDCVWLGYTDDFQGSSGVLYQSLGYGIPVISSKNGFIAKFVEENNIGVTCNSNKSLSIKNAILDLQNEIKNDKYTQMNKALKDLAKFHSPEEHMRQFIETVEHFNMYNR